MTNMPLRHAMSTLAAVALVAVFTNGPTCARPSTKGAAITSAALMGSQPKAPTRLATKRGPNTQPKTKLDLHFQARDSIIRIMRN